VSDVVQIESWTSSQGEVFGGSDWGKQNHHIILRSPFLCFGYSCEPVVPGPCARWIRVARQRWASPMFDPVVRQRFCHRRHLGGRWWDSHYGRQPRYWFTKPPTIHDTHARVQESNLHARILAALFRSIRECRNGREMDPPLPLMNHIFYLFIAGQQMNVEFSLMNFDNFWIVSLIYTGR
jgi:hypothetical protein